MDEDRPVLLFPDGTKISVSLCKACGALVPDVAAGDHEAFHVMYT